VQPARLFAFEIHRLQPSITNPLEEVASRVFTSLWGGRGSTNPESLEIFKKYLLNKFSGETGCNIHRLLSNLLSFSIKNVLWSRKLPDEMLYP
jgi:hypothetical protein